MGRRSGGVPAMSRPSSRISPASGRSNPAIMRSSVVFPQPEGPSRVKNSPASIAMLTLSTAVSAPKRRVTFLISRSAMGLRGGITGADYNKQPSVSRPTPRASSPVLGEAQDHRPGERQRQQPDREAEQPVAPPLEREQLLERVLDAPDAVIGEHAVQQARQLRQHRGPARRLVVQAAQQTAQADLLPHPALEVGLGGLPQVEVGVELAAEALDVEQRLLQHDELRLDLDAETARGLEQLQQHAPERDFLQRPVEDRLAHGADLGLEFVDARAGGHPAGLQVCLRDYKRVAQA